MGGDVVSKGRAVKSRAADGKQHSEDKRRPKHYIYTPILHSKSCH